MGDVSDFTPDAQQSLDLARKEADRLDHNFVGTEHLLLGMIKLGQGVAVTVLTKLGLDLETVRQEVEQGVGTGPDRKKAGRVPPITPRVQKVMALAQQEAKHLNHTYVGTEHLLLGLLREGEGVAGRVLRGHGMDLEQTRAEIVRELDRRSEASCAGQQTPSTPNENPAPQSRFEMPKAAIPGDPMVSAFTPRAQQVLLLARKEADRFNHSFLGTEHLLLGLIKLGQGVAVSVLAKLGLDLETVRQEVEKRVGKGPDQKMLGSIPYTPRVRKVIMLAQQEAKHLQHTYVGTEHLLLGLLREGGGSGAKVLRALEIDLVQTRNEILRELDPNFSPNKQQITEQESTAMNPRLEIPLDPEAGSGKPDSVATSQRYDVYCTERSTEIVVYRNALFKGSKRLLSSDSMGQFIELELADGQAIFVSRFSVIKFCEPGATPGGETVPKG
jgi:ATP-dependent Clp protease ATP-binding subunit ClpA